VVNSKLPPQAKLWKAGRLQREAERARDANDFGTMYTKGFEAAILREQAKAATGKPQQ
jgi:hypothetical protein